MNATPSSQPLQAALDRFARPIWDLMRAVGARLSPFGTPAGYPAPKMALSVPLVVLFQTRMQLILKQVRALAARFDAGTLRERAAPSRHGDPHSKRPARPFDPKKLRLPNTFGWVLRAAPNQGAQYAEGIRLAMLTPEMSALIGATPRMAKILHPLCWMLAINTDFLPATERKRRASEQAAMIPAAAADAVRAAHVWRGDPTDGVGRRPPPPPDARFPSTFETPSRLDRGPVVQISERG